MRRGLKRHSLPGPSVRALTYVVSGDADRNKPAQLAATPISVKRRNDLLPKGTMALLFRKAFECIPRRAWRGSPVSRAQSNDATREGKNPHRLTAGSKMTRG